MKSIALNHHRMMCASHTYGENLTQCGKLGVVVTCNCVLTSQRKGMGLNIAYFWGKGFGLLLSNDLTIEEQFGNHI